MANGHSIIPLDGGEVATGILEWLEERMIFVPDNLPTGRFPTPKELRHVIQKSDYDLEESQDWYVTADNDHTEIWFPDGNADEDVSTQFWCRRGGIIVLDIMQKLSNHCGSFTILDHSGAVSVFILPDSVFGIDLHESNGYVETVTLQISAIFKRIDAVSDEDSLFFLSHIWSVASSLKELRIYGLFNTLPTARDVIAKFLTHQDSRMRFLAMDLVVNHLHSLILYSETIVDVIRDELDIDMKRRMLQVHEQALTKRGKINPSRWTQGLLDAFLEIIEDKFEEPSLRLLAANYMARAELGFMTDTMREIFVQALTQPDIYAIPSGSESATRYVLKGVLEPINYLMLHDRISILLEVLPSIPYAVDAHETLGILLDSVFYGAKRNASKSSPLRDNIPAERPMIDEAKFREHDSRGWEYPLNENQIALNELLPFQREILKTVLDIETPWMVHSNILQKYGLPPTRAEVRQILQSEEE